MTKILTNEARELVRQYIAAYLAEPYIHPRGEQVARAKAWSFGVSIEDIALYDNVSYEAVRRSISTIVPLILRYAESKRGYDRS